jgi:hypothetical protein
MTLAQNSSPSAKKQLFTNAEAHPLALNLVMLKEFGPEYLGWEPETCWDEIKLTWGVNVSEANRQKIQAVRSIYVSDDTVAEWEVFENIAAGLVGNTPRLDIIQRPTPARAHIALDVIKNIREASTIKDEVYQYCAAVLMDHGMLYGPGSLEPANKFLKGVSADDQATVRNLVRSGSVPTLSSGGVILVQTMKSLSVRDYVRMVDASLARQIAQLSL